MFNFIKRKLHYLQLDKANSQKTSQTNSPGLAKDQLLSSDLVNNIKTLQFIFGQSNDIIYRSLKIGQEWGKTAVLIFIDGMTDKSIINENIIKPLTYDIQMLHFASAKSESDVETIKTNLISVGEVKEIKTIGEAVTDCLEGNSILLINGYAQGLSICTKGWESRGIQEPKTEAVVRGPREGFTESLRSNTVLLRRKIMNSNLTFETLKLGELSQTSICIAYIKSLVMPGLIDELKSRLEKIEIDAILESGYIEEFIEDAPFSPFATIANSEKPDVVAAKILEGRAAVLVDGTPFVLTVPMLFIESFQSAEDYYSRPYYVSIVRILRFLSYLITILAPAIYVSLSSFHQSLLPTALLLTMAQAQEATPFPSFVEAFGMGIVFEILREAGIRLPRPVGQAISIVGALVIGDAAVSAGLIGAPMVIVVAITAISSFVIPPQADSGAILRFYLLLLAGVLGAFGILFGLISILIHLSTLRSFGVPYFSPLTPLTPRNMKDSFIRLPWWSLTTRPAGIGQKDEKRIDNNLRPKPPQ